MTVALSSDQSVGLAFYEDWHDNKFDSRIPRGVSGIEANGGIRELPQDWSIRDGSPTVEDNTLKVPAGDTTSQYYYTPVIDYPYMRWEFPLQYQAIPGTGQAYVAFARENQNPIRWWFYWGSGGNLQLEYYDGSSYNTVVSGSQTLDTNEHTVKIENRNGTWEVWFDGTSLGTGTQDSWPSGIERFSVGNTSDAAVWFPRFEIQYLD